MLRTLCPVRVYPSYARKEYARSGLRLDPLRISLSTPLVSGSTPTPSHKLGSVGAWEESLHLQTIISPKGASALLLLVPPGLQALESTKACMRGGPEFCFLVLVTIKVLKLSSDQL